MPRVALVVLSLVSGVLWAGVCKAQARIDYSGLLSPQLAAVPSQFVLAPLSTVPFSFSSNPQLIGRLYGRADIVPSVQLYDGAFGVQVGLYSNENTAYQRTRRVVQFDNANLNLTRIKPETPLAFDALALFFTDAFGRIELGYGSGISERTKVTAPLDYGVGSIGGDYPYFLDKPLDVGFNTISAYGSANTSPRLLYLSPRVYGVQAGATYQPDTRDTGLDFTYGRRSFGILGRQPTPSGTFEGVSAGFVNVAEAGLNYDDVFGGVRVKASLAGIRGDPVRSPSGTLFNGLASFQAGLQLGYGNWSIGAGYVEAGTSGYTKFASKRQRKEQYDLQGGIEYTTGPWTLGGAVLYSSDEGDPTERSNRQFMIVSSGARYQVTSDFDIGLEVDQIRTLSADFGDYTNYAGIVQLRYRFAGSQFLDRPGRP